MREARLRFIPYPPIERLAVIGDRRSAALVAADGTICWCCLPDFDSAPVFGALLDTVRGGYFRFGPAAPCFGTQAYLPASAVLTTRWDLPEGRLELTDLMLRPETQRAPEHRARRTILRRLRCTGGTVKCLLSIVPRPDFTAPLKADPHGFALKIGGPFVGLWSSDGFGDASGFYREFALTDGDEAWVVLGLGEIADEWSVERARGSLAATIAYWRRWADCLSCPGPRHVQIMQSGILVHLLSYAPTGAPIAAPTTSLPERIGGPRNFDYRFAWIRDASLSLSLLSELGFTGDEERYLDWLAQLPPGKHMPLQTVYRADGSTIAPEREINDLNGYRESLPVRFGNRAFGMKEIGSLGYLADCVWTYVERDGIWKEEYWHLMHRIADFVAGHWRARDHGIWELQQRDFVTTRVLCWAVLDRTIKIADRVGRSEAPRDTWRREMAKIQAEVSKRGWSDTINSFRQHYDADTVDAALLLIPLLQFLPGDDPRVERTVAQIEARLTIDGFLCRFAEQEFPGQGRLPLAEEEGAFVMCTAWLAHYYVLRREYRKAEAILCRLEATAPLGLMSEAVDARSGALLGNMPLLFSQVEYAKTAFKLAGGKLG